MDESALRLLISNLERSRATLDSWLSVFTLFVVVGVVLEVVFVIWEYRDELHDWRRGFVHPPEKPKFALLIFGLFGAGLVAIGVAGELYIGAKIGAIETSIREANDQRASLLSKLAGDAAASAKIAHDEADAVKGIADKAREDAKDALAKAQAAQRELAHAESDAREAQTAASRALNTADQAASHIAEALQRAANAEMEAERLRKQLADRTLTDDQVRSIGQKLKIFKGQGYIITAYWDSKESLGIANRIQTALAGFAGWSYSDEGQKSMMLGGMVGVAVWIHPEADETTKRAAKALIDALNAEGIDAEPREQNPKNPKSNMIAINVGSKR